MATVKKPRKSKPSKIEVGSGNVFRDVGFSRKDAAIMESESQIAFLLGCLEREIGRPIGAVEILRYSKGSYNVGIRLEKRRPSRRL